MNKTRIEWTDYTVNPVKGYCPVGCPYCYARRMYDRFKWDKTIRFSPLALPYGISKIRDEAPRIFVGSTIELFGDWVKDEWLESIFMWVRKFDWCTFIFLTKQPQNLQKWSPFPDNCYVGVSVCNDRMLDVAVDKLEDVKAKCKFISFEPLLAQLTLSLDYAFYYSGISWVIIGAETGNRNGKVPLGQVQIWAREIIRAADEAGIPVFIKDNLKLPANEVRREFPQYGE